ncbi:hypothetical protein YC2023_109574 [Brassica napus]
MVMKKCRLGITSRALGKETRTLDDICNFMLMSCTSFLIDLLINGTKRLRLIMQGQAPESMKGAKKKTTSKDCTSPYFDGEEASESVEGAEKKKTSNIRLVMARMYTNYCNHKICFPYSKKKTPK